jgi:hypothetical protein
VDNLFWVVPLALGLIAVLRKSGGVKRGLASFQQQIVEAQQAALAAQRAPTAPRAAPGSAEPRLTAQHAMRRPVLAPAPSVALPSAAARAAMPPAGRSVLAAFGDPEHARTAIVLAEILGPPVALR